MMKRKILFVTVILLAIAALASPVSAKPPGGNPNLGWDLVIVDPPSHEADALCYSAAGCVPGDNMMYYPTVVELVMPPLNWAVQVVVLKDGEIHQTQEDWWFTYDNNCHILAIGELNITEDFTQTYTIMAIAKGKTITEEITLHFDVEPLNP